MYLEQNEQPLKIPKRVLPFTAPLTEKGTAYLFLNDNNELRVLYTSHPTAPNGIYEGPLVPAPNLSADDISGLGTIVSLPNGSPLTYDYYVDMTGINHLFIVADCTGGNINVYYDTVHNTVGKKITVFRADASANTLTVHAYSDIVEYINGATTKTLSSQYDSITTMSDGVENCIIAETGLAGGGSGDVTGPASSTGDNLVSFNGATGKIIKDSGKSVSTDGTFGSNSDSKIPTEKAVKTYADGLVAGLLDYRGGYDASSNAYPSSGGSGSGGAIMKGDMWVVSVAGTLGGVDIQVGDSVIANVDSPGSTSSNWNTLNVNISYVPEDVANKDTDGTLAANSDTKYASQKATKTYADTKVPQTRTINGQDLTTNRTLILKDINVLALAFNPTDAQTIYFGNNPKQPTTSRGQNKIYFRETCTITSAEIFTFAATAGTNENWSMYIRLNNTTDYLIATVGVSAQERVFSNTSMSVPIVSGDYIEFKLVNPTWATNPVTVTIGGYFCISN